MVTNQLIGGVGTVSTVSRLNKDGVWEKVVSVNDETREELGNTLSPPPPPLSFSPSLPPRSQLSHTHTHTYTHTHSLSLFPFPSLSQHDLLLLQLIGKMNWMAKQSSSGLTMDGVDDDSGTNRRIRLG